MQNDTTAYCPALGFNISDFKSGGFKVYETAGSVAPPLSYARRDFYKIVLASGNITICYGNQTIPIDGAFLVFLNPHVPYSVTHHAIDQKGFACLFTEAYIESREWQESLQHSPYFRFSDMPVVPVNGEQYAFLATLYKKMLAIHNSDYEQKKEVLKRCIELILHEGLAIQPAENKGKQKNAATRITYLFVELLERQFPIENISAPLTMRTAQDFAKILSVHVNYLNKSVKDVTGKPVSVHIAKRIAAEAKALLQHTNWSVADVAYALGFEYPTYFNNYFKRVTGVTPKFFRL
jgi:AraC family transcriptional activator of pobA